MQLRELDAMAAREDLWSDPEKAKDILKKQSQIQEQIIQWTAKRGRLNDLEELYALALEENDSQTLEDVERDVLDLKNTIRDQEFRMMLSAEQDHLSAIMSIHAGAGGTEAQDWAEMLLKSNQ